MNFSNAVNWCRSFFTRRGEMPSLSFALMKVSMQSAMVGCSAFMMIGMTPAPLRLAGVGGHWPSAIALIVAGTRFPPSY
jgi:hypothetical protein